MSDISLLEKYFPGLDKLQRSRFQKIKELYIHWNNIINVISRKDMDMFYLHHVLHSLSIAKFVHFRPKTRVMDLGTGGGFPGIPLAIMFPEVSFLLVDSIGKKIKVVNEIASELDLKNVKAIKARAEEIDARFDFIVTRAVTAFPELVKWTKGKIDQKGNNEIPNGIIALKGGNLEEELKDFKNKLQVINIGRLFDEPFFDTKKIVYYHS